MRVFPGIAIVFLSIWNVSCGTYTTTHVKDFAIYVESDDDDINETIRVLADEYNEDFGGEAITIVDSEDESNSSIGFISGLKSRENKLGLGQWITVTSQEGQNLVGSTDTELEKTIVYSMELDFDLQNFESKMDSRDNKSDGDWRHLYHLFCHEVGHGLQMVHEANRLSVMYKSIPDQSRRGVDYAGYFENARNFFRD